MHRLVTPGWPVSSVGNEPSACCCAASHSSARFTAASTCRHCSRESTFAGVPSSRLLRDGSATLSLIVVVDSDRCAMTDEETTSSTIPATATQSPRTAIMPSLPLINGQKLVRRAEGQQNQRRSVSVAKSRVMVVVFRWPGTVGLLVGEQCPYGVWKKLLPIMAAKLIHRLAAIEQAVMVAVILPTLHERLDLVVIVEIVLQDPLSGPRRFRRVVVARMGQRENPGARHAATAKIDVLVSNIAKRSIPRRKRSPNVGHGV